MALRRGFKAEAERIAERLRVSLRRARDSALLPEEVASHLRIELVPADKLIARERLDELERIQRGCFSACTFHFPPQRTVIVFNPLNVPARVRSDLAHELSHVLLDHKLSRLERLGNVPFFSCDSGQEEEANWLSGCLLLPRALLFSLVTSGMKPAGVAEHCGVSEDLATWRINVTGVQVHAARAARTRRTSRATR